MWWFSSLTTYAPRPPAPRHSAISWAGGARVIIIPINTPYSYVATKGESLQDVVGNTWLRHTAPLYGEPRYRERMSILEHAIDLEKEEGATKTVEELSTILGKLFDGSVPRKLRAMAFHRFIDASIGTNPLGAIPLGGLGKAEPLRLQLLEPNPQQATASALLLRLTEDTKNLAGALEPIPLAYGSIIGQGHLLVLGYSIFDGIGERSLWSEPKNGRVLRLLNPGVSETLGSTLVARLIGKVDRLAPLPAESPRVTEIRARDRRFLELSVAQKMDTRRDIPESYLVELNRCNADGIRSGGKLDLVAVDLVDQTATYALSPKQRMQLCRGLILCGLDLHLAVPGGEPLLMAQQQSSHHTRSRSYPCNPSHRRPDIAGSAKVAANGHRWQRYTASTFAPASTAECPQAATPLGPTSVLTRQYSPWLSYAELASHPRQCE